jgi:response regulator RpfG family c-di-GMP phosphodiesterase
MELSEREIDILHAVGLLHDLAKIGISLEVLDKPGISTPEEPTHSGTRTYRRANSKPDSRI